VRTALLPAPPDAGSALENPAAVTRDTLFEELMFERQALLDRVASGAENELDVDELELALQLDLRIRENDHVKLVRVAYLAIQYGGSDAPDGGQRALIQRFARTFRLDPDALRAYALVLQRELRHREKTGATPLADLPRLTGVDEPAAVPEWPALPVAPHANDSPAVCVDMKQQGLANREIGRRLGVSEATVRRRLVAARAAG
jgi:hypothetical protein